METYYHDVPSRPVGNSLEGRKFFGLAYPSGRFKSGGSDPCPRITDRASAP